ncbi:MAG TPA: 3D-(3,5/4)-trihydroxycyclohexane-1,2-dione acylhydrolase (decyclizing) [Dongiaceae bacterium]|jgi:3D-(3,5/4)-trihydroxycyclohexane-1,2-dione acylhydrolase (decyclizing)|nr:3D-(3,5/4)-trihydroxycyclohexane-1,2-dione acylhydrolase (decyclizing) [Dongiaceae bacterium]
MKNIRLTMAQAVVRYLANQRGVRGGKDVPLFAGVWAIFGHGNVAGLGEALYHAQETLPTYRAHNEQGMAHAAIAFAKAARRRQMMACTTSIGPGATNMLTAAAVAHVNRLPVLFLPGDVFANRRPDPVLQQIEDFGDGTVSANDCFRPVSRYFDRITRPEQILTALPRALGVLTDPADCGPVTLAMCQDVQTEAYDYPEAFFEPHVWATRRPEPDRDELAHAASHLKRAKKPMIVSGGGVLYSEAERALADFADKHGIPVCETQAGKSAMDVDHKQAMGAVGVTGTSAANSLAKDADLVLAIGTRLQDFTTGSRALFQNPERKIIGLNTQAFDAGKHGAIPLIADARTGIAALSKAIGDWSAPGAWQKQAASARKTWSAEHVAAVAAPNRDLPSDGQVIGAVQRAGKPSDIVVCAAGGLPGELHKLWQSGSAGGYHMEYGYSCMGYEIAGGLGVKLARPDADVIVMVGDGSYLMMNSELATSVMLGQKLIVVLLDNRGYGCINRLQRATGGESFNNLLQHTKHEVLPDIDFAAHARSLGANAEKVATTSELEAALGRARKSKKSALIVIDTDPLKTTEAGGFWWDVPVPEVSERPKVRAARKKYQDSITHQRIGE